MARIRTVKPEFFRHERLFEAERETGLPLRVAFAGLWTAADREGRFVWRPRQLKLDCLPYDEVDFSRVLAALAAGGFVVAYEVEGMHYGVIPSWKSHQVINMREAKSAIPPPPFEGAHLHEDMERTCTHVHARGEGKGREGKGKERKGVEASRETSRQGSRFALTHLPDDWKADCKTERPDLDHDAVFAKFRDYWAGVPGAKGRKLDWRATWRNFVRTERPPVGAKAPEPRKPWHETASGVEARGRELGITPDKFLTQQGTQDWQAFTAAVRSASGNFTERSGDA